MESDASQRKSWGQVGSKFRHLGREVSAGAQGLGQGLRLRQGLEKLQGLREVSSEKLQGLREVSSGSLGLGQELGFRAAALDLERLSDLGRRAAAVKAKSAAEHARSAAESLRKRTSQGRAGELSEEALQRQREALRQIESEIEEMADSLASGSAQVDEAWINHFLQYHQAYMDLSSRMGLAEESAKGTELIRNVLQHPAVAGALSQADGELGALVRGAEDGGEAGAATEADGCGADGAAEDSGRAAAGAGEPGAPGGDASEPEADATPTAPPDVRTPEGAEREPSAAPEAADCAREGAPCEARDVEAPGATRRAAAWGGKAASDKAQTQPKVPSMLGRLAESDVTELAAKLEARRRAEESGGGYAVSPPKADARHLAAAPRLTEMQAKLAARRLRVDGEACCDAQGAAGSSAGQ